jgi:hypothetical protein
LGTSLRTFGLREFCLAADYDPSNWSKIERGILSPPQESETLRRIATVLELREDSDEWTDLHSFAAIEAGKIPEHILNDEEMLKQLPIFFRTLNGKKPERDQLIKLAEILKKRE